MCYWKVKKPLVHSAESGFPVFSEKDDRNDHQCFVYGLPEYEYKDLMKVDPLCIFFLNRPQ